MNRFGTHMNIVDLGKQWYENTTDRMYNEKLQEIKLTSVIREILTQSFLKTELSQLVTMDIYRHIKDTHEVLEWMSEPSSR